MERPFQKIFLTSISLIYFVCIPIVFGIFLIGNFGMGVVESDSGIHPSQLAAATQNLELFFTIILFIIAASILAIEKYGAYKIAWLVSLIPAIYFFILLNVHSLPAPIVVYIANLF